MSRVFWMVVGAAGGVVAYRRGTQAVARARELGPLGTAAVAAHATSRLAGRTAHGLGRLQSIKDQREGRLVIGSAEDVTQVRTAPAMALEDDEWIPVPDGRPRAPQPARPSAGSQRTGPAPAERPASDPAIRTAPGPAAASRATPRTTRARKP
jgi:hypothetical protein